MMPIPPTALETIGRGIIGLSRANALQALGRIAASPNRQTAQAAAKIAAAIKANPAIRMVSDKVIAVARVARR